MGFTTDPLGIDPTRLKDYLERGSRAVCETPSVKEGGEIKRLGATKGGHIKLDWGTRSKTGDQGSKRKIQRRSRRGVESCACRGVAIGMGTVYKKCVSCLASVRQRDRKKGTVLIMTHAEYSGYKGLPDIRRGLWGGNE